MMFLIFERIFALITLGVIVWGIWFGDVFDIYEFIVAFVLCNIWLATIDMRKDGK